MIGFDLLLFIGSRSSVIYCLMEVFYMKGDRRGETVVAHGSAGNERPDDAQASAAVRAGFEA